MLYAGYHAGLIMSEFSIHLLDATHAQKINGVASFVGEDTSGSFGILPNHARFMTTLVYGLARFKANTESWRYIAVPGAVLYFNDNKLTISTRHFLIDDDFERISTQLYEQLLAEEDNLRTIKESLHLMENEMLKRLWNFRRKTVI